MGIVTGYDVEKVLDDYQHDTGDESLKKYLGNDLFLPADVEYDLTAMHHDLTDQVGDGYDFKWSDYIINEERGGILNNLNFDNDEEFGLRVSAYNLALDTTNRAGTTTFSLYDSNNFNPGKGERANAGDATGSSVDPEALAKTLWFYPIKISGIIYRVDESSTGTEPIEQLNEATFDFLRQNIDGSILRKGEIQQNYTRRNWWKQGNLAVISGELLITPDTQQLIEVFNNNNIDLTFLVDSLGY